MIIKCILLDLLSNFINGFDTVKGLFDVANPTFFQKFTVYMGIYYRIFNNKGSDIPLKAEHSALLFLVIHQNIVKLILVHVARCLTRDNYRHLSPFIHSRRDFYLATHLLNELLGDK